MLGGVDSARDRSAAPGGGWLARRHHRRSYFGSPALMRSPTRMQVLSFAASSSAMRLPEWSSVAAYFAFGGAGHADCPAVSARARSAVAAAASGGITPDTPVFDTTVGTLGAWRTGFEKRAADSWHAQLVPRAPIAGA